MRPQPDPAPAPRDTMPYELVYALTNDLAFRDDPLATLWSVLVLAEEHPGIAVVSYDPEDPCEKARAAGRVLLVALREAGAEPRNREALARTARATVRRLLAVIEAWEGGEGTSELERRWPGFVRGHVPGGDREVTSGA